MQNSAPPIDIRECTSVDELDACISLQREVFGLSDQELSPRRHLIVTQHAGGWTLGAFSEGELIRDALHVSDVVKAVGACVDRPAERGYTVMNLGCGRAIKTLEYAEALVSSLGSASKIVPVDRKASQVDLYANIERARRLIGFEPMTLHESMTEYANELRA